MPTNAALSDRSLGWLRYLQRKASTPDDWSRDGHPHPHWDNRSDPPMASWHRFDLVDSSYALGLMAHTTPAWREVYVEVLDQLIERHTGWWSAADWGSQFGPDPDRAAYPEAYRRLIPEEVWGDYDVPGWTANGIAPWELDLDPIRSESMLFYKGFFLVLLGIRALVSPDGRWNDPFDLIKEGAASFSWTHSRIAEQLSGQMRRRPQGCHCENTKIWPY